MRGGGVGEAAAAGLSRAGLGRAFGAGPSPPLPPPFHPPSPPPSLRFLLHPALRLPSAPTVTCHLRTSGRSSSRRCARRSTSSVSFCSSSALSSPLSNQHRRASIPAVSVTMSGSSPQHHATTTSWAAHVHSATTSSPLDSFASSLASTPPDSACPPIGGRAAQQPMQRAFHLPAAAPPPLLSDAPLQSYPWHASGPGWHPVGASPSPALPPSVASAYSTELLYAPAAAPFARSPSYSPYPQPTSAYTFSPQPPPLSSLHSLGPAYGQPYWSPAEPYPQRQFSGDCAWNGRGRYSDASYSAHFRPPAPAYVPATAPLSSPSAVPYSGLSPHGDPLHPPAAAAAAAIIIRASAAAADAGSGGGCHLH